MGDSKLTIELDAETDKIDSALDSMERRVEKIEQRFRKIFSRVGERMPDAPFDKRLSTASDATGRTTRDAEAYRLWRKDQDATLRRVEKQVKTDARLEDRAATVAFRRQTSEIKGVERDLRNADRADTRESRSGEARVAAWRSAAINKSILSGEDKGGGGRGILAELFGGGSKRGASGLVGRGASWLMGERTAGVLGGAARLVGGATLGVMGGGGVAGTLASALLGPLGLLGGVVTSIAGKIMAAGSEMVSKTQSMLPAMVAGQFGAPGTSRGMWQAQRMESERWGIHGEESDALAAAADRAAGAQIRSRFDNTIGTGARARMKMQGIGGEVGGKYAGLSKRYGIQTGGERGAERMATLGYAMGLRGDEFAQTITGGYEAMGAKGLGVDTAGFESFLGRALGNEAFAGGGIQSVKGMVALEGMRGAGRDALLNPFKEMGQNMMLAKATRLASASGKTGVGLLAEMQNIYETSPEMGAEGVRNTFKAFGPDMGQLLTSASSGMTGTAARGLMGNLPAGEVGLPGGMLPSPLDASSKAMLAAYNTGGADVGRMGDPETIKSLVKLQQASADISASMAKTAGHLASAVTSFTGK